MFGLCMIQASYKRMLDGQAQVTTKHREETILFTGRNDGPHRGVALIMKDSGFPSWNGKAIIR